ncbi:MAG: T9SS type A sorting domain-containing protein [Candidatus Delongbacteria bacterium]|nr:T9SS type A sorting domain-containing protein [Candidatus Delongbacteria bacterium]MBN2834953.1 T9SS type A sorting domain-containing protein [Candidatus Delongbacteria bacterium]
MPWDDEASLAPNNNIINIDPGLIDPVNGNYYTEIGDESYYYGVQTRGVEIHEGSQVNSFIKNIYPNPFNSIITIEFSSISDKYVKMTLFNLNGEKIKNLRINANTKLNSITINTKNLSSGVYILQILSKKHGISYHRLNHIK